LLPETSNRPFLTAAGRRLLERRIAALEHAVAELRSAIEDPESRTESVGAYLRTLRERDHLRAVLGEADLVEDAFVDDPAVVELGDRVIIRRDDGTVERYILVHPAEAAVDSERISIESPLGRALLSRRVGEIVSVVAPGASYCCRILTAARPRT
jgi:transcription elongation GreA/GreB family factor